MKKPIKAIALITAISASLLAGCATYQSPADSTPTTPPPSTPVSSVSSTLPDKYNTVLELRSEGYQSLLLGDFNSTVKAKIDKDLGFLSTFSEFMSSLTTEDSEYQFVYETLNYSIDEIISPQMGNPVSISRYLKNYSEEYTAGISNDETFYNFMFTAHYSVEYRVIDETALTVQERDELLCAYQTELQSAVSGMDKEQLLSSGCKNKLQGIADDLANDLSTDTLIFENAEIQSIEILNDGQDYQK